MILICLNLTLNPCDSQHAFLFSLWTTWWLDALNWTKIKLGLFCLRIIKEHKRCLINISNLPCWFNKISIWTLWIKKIHSFMSQIKTRLKKTMLCSLNVWQYSSFCSRLAFVWGQFWSRLLKSRCCFFFCLISEVLCHGGSYHFKQSGEERRLVWPTGMFVLTRS